VKLEELYKEIVRELEKHADAELASKKVAQAKYFGVDCKSYGIERSEMSELVEGYLEDFRKLSLEERSELAKMFCASDFSEQVSLGDSLLKLSLKEMTPAHYDFLDKIGDCLNDWGDTDWFCSEITKPLLTKYPEETLELLRRWNSAENLWKRRASVVTFTRKIGESGEFTDEALELCDNLIWDKEDYVRKGVGWALKDNMRGAKKRVLEYVKSLRRKGVSSVITLYAIRDLKGKEREGVLKIRPDRKLERA